MRFANVAFVAFLTIALMAVAGGAGPVFAQDDLPPPSGVTAVEVGTGEVVVSWNEVRAAPFYRVGWVAYEDMLRVTAAGREWLDAFVFVDVANLGQTEYTVSRLEPGKPHYFIVASLTDRFGKASWPDGWSDLLTLSADLPACPLAQQPAEPSVDRPALVALYHATGGSDWTISAGWLTDAPVGRWHGISVNADNRVTEIDLRDNGLAGSIPPELGNLSHLQRLHLAGNALTGCIPVGLRGVSQHDLSALGLLDCIVNREMEYRHSIDIPGEWEQLEDGSYRSSVHGGGIRITSQQLHGDHTLEQFSHAVRSDLPRDWWWTAFSVLGEISVQQTQVGDRPAQRLRYRVQESPQFCPLDVAELITVSDDLPGPPQGFRARVWMCDHNVAAHGAARDRILDSFRVETGPATYYRQFISVNGVSVKAAGMVDPAAVRAGADIVVALLSGREDIARCMARQGAALAIIPRDQVVSELPEYAHLSGTSDFTGRSYDSYDLRGLGGTAAQPVSSAAEEQLLGNRGPEHAYQPYRGLVAVHEFAHGVQNICFTPADHDQWDAFYADALGAGLYPGAHLMANVMEFFAVFTTAYFEVTDELGPNSTRQTLSTRYPEISQALHVIYAGATLPERYRELLPR